MNEPSVFDSDELTLPRDALHRVDLLTDDPMAAAGVAMGVGAVAAANGTADVEHRAVHNAYGALQAASTHAGLLARTGATERPCLRSRSFFIGSQRYGAVWTGDNTASWAHLRLSFAMCLSLSLSGLSFVGGTAVTTRARVGRCFKTLLPC